MRECVDMTRERAICVKEEMRMGIPIWIPIGPAPPAGFLPSCYDHEEFEYCDKRDCPYNCRNKSNWGGYKYDD
jgi:hypothetical protein